MRDSFLVPVFLPKKMYEFLFPTLVHLSNLGAILALGKWSGSAPRFSVCVRLTLHGSLAHASPWSIPRVPLLTSILAILLRRHVLIVTLIITWLTSILTLTCIATLVTIVTWSSIGLTLNKFKIQDTFLFKSFSTCVGELSEIPC